MIVIVLDPPVVKSTVKSPLGKTSKLATQQIIERTDPADLADDRLGSSSLPFALYEVDERKG
jgi:hypothetical protein